MDRKNWLVKIIRGGIEWFGGPDGWLTAEWYAERFKKSHAEKVAREFGGHVIGDRWHRS